MSSSYKHRAIRNYLRLEHEVVGTAVRTYIAHDAAAITRVWYWSPALALVRVLVIGSALAAHVIFVLGPVLAMSRGEQNQKHM